MTTILRLSSFFIYCWMFSFEKVATNTPLPGAVFFAAKTLSTGRWLLIYCLVTITSFTSFTLLLTSNVCTSPLGKTRMVK
jgi:hypothetical protein